MQSFVPDWLDPLRERLLPRLKDNSLTIDTRMRLNIEAWINAAQERNLLTDDPRSAQGALRSIISKSAREQNLFDQVFEAWCVGWQAEGQMQAITQVARSIDSDSSRQLKLDKPGEERVVWRQQFLALIVIVIGMVAVVGLIAYFAGKNGSDSDIREPNPIKASPKPSFTIENLSSNKVMRAQGEIPVQPIDPAQKEVQLPTSPWLFGVHPLFYALLIILLAGTELFTHRSRKTQLARIATREHLREQEIYVRQLLPVSGKRRLALRAAARLLRKPTATESKVLDIQASALTTATRAGMFLPIYRMRMVTPAYIWLVDRASSGDQLAHWAAEMARDLAAEGVVLTLYEFDRDPRWVTPLHIHRSLRGATPQRYVPLSSLVASHLGQGMFVLADGHDFIDPMTGKPYGWLQSALAPWPRRVLMTPRPLANWGVVEDMLAGEELPAQADSFLVLPAQIDSLTVAAKWLLDKDITAISPLPGAPAVLPTLLQYDDMRWLGRDPPTATELVTLIEQLRAYLGPTAYSWLAASAAYPQLSADLTAYFAQRLTDSPASGIDAVDVASTDVRLLEARLVAIAQLPWCRHAIMPDWFRRALLLSLPLGSRERIQQVLENLLRSATSSDEAADLSLGMIASGNPDSVRKKNMLQRLRRWIGNIDLETVVENEPSESPLRDVIYLGVLRDDFDSELTLDAPQEFARVVGEEMGSRLTFNPIRWLTAAVLMVVFPLLWLNWWVREQFQTEKSDIKTDEQQLRECETPVSFTEEEKPEAQSTMEKQENELKPAVVCLSYVPNSTTLAIAAGLRERLIRELGIGVCEWNFTKGDGSVDMIGQVIDGRTVIVLLIDEPDVIRGEYIRNQVSMARNMKQLVISVLINKVDASFKREFQMDVFKITGRKPLWLLRIDRLHEEIKQISSVIVRIIKNDAKTIKQLEQNFSE